MQKRFLIPFFPALTYYYIQPHLVAVVDFSRAFLSSGIGIVMKNRPKAEDSLRDFILNSFTLDGWMLILGEPKTAYEKPFPRLFNAMKSPTGEFRSGIESGGKRDWSGAASRRI